MLLCDKASRHLRASVLLLCCCGQCEDGFSCLCRALRMVGCAAVLVMKFFFDHFGFTSSGAIAALVQGLLAKEMWKRGIPSNMAGENAGHVYMLMLQ